MTVRSSGRELVAVRHARPAAAFLLVSAAGAWLAVLAISGGMSGMPATMGLRVVAFVGVWTLMMAAMMLPGVTPFASFYTRTFTEHRQRRLFTFAAGYLLAWSALGLPAFGLAWITERLVADDATVATGIAALIFLSCGVYQLSPLKDRCLALCRSPLGFTLKYSAYQGRGRDVRAGSLHGLFCAGCCWALMLMLLAFGLMNVLAMLAVAAVVLIEKRWRRGAGFAHAVGVASIVLAVLVVAFPAIAPGAALTEPNNDQGNDVNEWEVRGSYFEGCNCEAICPCRAVHGHPGGPSTYGECFGALSWIVQEGHADNLDLSGLSVVMTLRYFDNVEPTTRWEVVLYIDDHADALQLAALADIFLGRAGGTVAGLYGPAIGQVHAVRSARITLEHVAPRKRIGVVGYVTLESEGPASDPGDVQCGIPGFDHPGTELYGTGFEATDPLLRFEVRGKRHASFFTDFDYHSQPAT